ncbi:hypothetical protein [Lactobacillus sp. LL6]|uniref:hypothetical protein n=1 Tax=Lactobacillus sp. LL6 TaxID=2596827 RepID=UPI001184B96A|nr:hypothetical protein [Lactobacillus sp. LL6]TSO26913.1 hypothetical protein FOD82_07795 [Lactobacillus sp. LL6]
MKFRKLLLITVLTASSVAFLSTTPKQAEATTIKDSSVEKITSNKNLTKQGYVLNVKDPSGKIYVGKADYKHGLKTSEPFKGKTINWKKIKNIKFRIEKMATAKKAAIFGAPQYFVASKDKKYSGWTTRSGLSYYFANTKAMKNVMKPLKIIIDRDSSSLKNAKNKKDFNLALKAAKKLPANQRKLVMQSLNQIKKDGNLENRSKNILLFEF